MTPFPTGVATALRLLLIGAAATATLAVDAGNTAQAARFCVTDEKSRHCTFDSYKACRQIAQSRGAFCSVNHASLGVPEGNSQMCAVTATSYRYNFQTINLCRKAAKQGDGLCVLRPHQAPRRPLPAVRAAPD